MGFLSIDGTFFVQVVDLIVFIVLLNVVFLKPVGAVIAKRRAYLDQLQSDIENAEGDVRALRAQADHKRLAARRGADEALASMRSAAQTEAAGIGDQFGAQASAIAEKARAVAAAEEAAARADEPRVVADLARTMVERVVGTGTGA